MDMGEHNHTRGFVDRDGVGLVVFGIPYYSPFDERVHVFHGAVDWGNYANVQQISFNDDNEFNDMGIDYDQIASGNYDSMSTYQIVMWQWASENTWGNLMRYGNLSFNTGYAIGDNYRSDERTRETLEESRTVIVPLSIYSF